MNGGDGGKDRRSSPRSWTEVMWFSRGAFKDGAAIFLMATMLLFLNLSSVRPSGWIADGIPILGEIPFSNITLIDRTQTLVKKSKKKRRRPVLRRDQWSRVLLLPVSFFEEPTNEEKYPELFSELRSFIPDPEEWIWWDRPLIAVVGHFKMHHYILLSD